MSPNGEERAPQDTLQDEMKSLDGGRRSQTACWEAGSSRLRDLPTSEAAPISHKQRAPDTPGYTLAVRSHL